MLCEIGCRCGPDRRSGLPKLPVRSLSRYSWCCHGHADPELSHTHSCSPNARIPELVEARQLMDLTIAKSSPRGRAEKRCGGIPHSFLMCGRCCTICFPQVQSVSQSLRSITSASSSRNPFRKLYLARATSADATDPIFLQNGPAATGLTIVLSG